MDGTNDPSNLVELTVAEHAEAHRILYEKHGKKEDLVAWKGLSGQIGREEFFLERSKLGAKKGNANGAYLKGNKVHVEKMKDPEYLANWKKAQKAGLKEDHGKWNIGITRTEEQKENYKNVALSRPRVPCKHCGKGYTKPNLKKHENACRV